MNVYLLLLAAAAAAIAETTPQPIQAPMSVLVTWDRSPSRSPECSCPRGTVTPVYYRVYRLSSTCPRVDGETINFDGFVPISTLIPDTSFTDTFNNGVDLRPGYYCYAVTGAFSRDEPVADVESSPTTPVQILVWPASLAAPPPGKIWAYIVAAGDVSGFILIPTPAGELGPQDDDDAPMGFQWVSAWTADHGSGRVLIPAFAP